MDHMILGLLLFGSKTIYQLWERIDKGLNFIYSSSLGSIQAAIKKLLREGYIQCEGVTGSRKCKFYTITDSGRAHFTQWVNAPMSTCGLKNPDAGKLYFLGVAQRENRAEIVQSYLDQLKQVYFALERICQEGEATSVPEDGQDILRYQLLSAQYGRDLLHFHIQWYTALLSQIRRTDGRN